MKTLVHGGGILAQMAGSRYPRQEQPSIARAGAWVLVGASMFWPRLFMLGFFIFDDDIEAAFSSWIVPIIGFFVLPWTTVGYAAMWSISSNEVTGLEWVFVAACVLLDVATWSALRRLRAPR